MKETEFVKACVIGGCAIFGTLYYYYLYPDSKNQEIPTQDTLLNNSTANNNEVAELAPVEEQPFALLGDNFLNELLEHWV
jgi:hypothetical protein